MSFPVFDNFMAQDQTRLVDKCYNINRAQGRLSALIEKGEIPEGAGYAYQTVLYNRSGAVGGSDWQAVNQENGSSNNCVQQPATIRPSITLIDWAAIARQVRSNPICFEDLRRAYNVREQLDFQHENFARTINDIWEDKDNERFFYYTGHKMIANSTFTELTGTTMPLQTPTTRAMQVILDNLYERISVDGGCEEAYAFADGVPLITAIMSQQQHRNIIKEDTSVRQDFNYADMGKGMAGTLMKSWGGDLKAYGGYHHVINIRQPRYNWTGAAWYQEPYYQNTATGVNVGYDQQVVNPNYTNAAYEDIYLWHKLVVKRNMPNPGGSFGSGTSFDPVKWNGAVVWVNVKNTDVNSDEYNPFGNTGRYYAALQAGYQPIKKQYGYAIRVQRCTKFTANACY